MAVGRGNGKLILFGEHAAVYGQPALGIQLPHYLEVRLEPAPSGRGSRGGGNSHDAEKHAGWVLPELDEHSTRLIRAALDALPGALGYTPDPHRMELAGNLPQSVGLGSSAAFCVALLRAIAPERFAGTRDSAGPRARERLMDLWKTAHALEGVFHGTPSGIDTGLCVFPGASLLFPHPPDIPRRVRSRPVRAWIVAGAVPRVASTAELVRGIRERREADSESVEEAMKKLGAASMVARRSPMMRRLGLGMIAKLADDAHETLADLGLTIPAVDTALELLRSHGALGGKMSGGGGGGAFLAVFADESTAAGAAEALRSWLAENHPLPTGAFATVVRL